MVLNETDTFGSTFRQQVGYLLGCMHHAKACRGKWVGETDRWQVCLDIVVVYRVSVAPVVDS
jgi:hypothetical protein